MNGSDEVVALDELRLLVVVDNETDTLSSVDDGVPQIPEAARVAALRPTTDFGGHPGKVAFDSLCCACHGLSVLATARRGEEERTLLFDVGPYASVWKANAARLGVDLAAIELVFLSHWHFDHSGGFPEVVAAIADARRKRGLPPPIVDLHPDRPDQRGILLPSGIMMLLPKEPAVEEMEAAGGRVAKHGEAHPLLDGLAFASGAIERVTAYETGFPGASSPTR
jgi:7,8-dihydropterin-6-yl-methyl-4-(beta-D-ribofuranosyl)aminobenzene 5'-phosphate synthase